MEINDIINSVLYEHAVKINLEKQRKEKEKIIKEMAKYRSACEKAANKGRFSKTFIIGCGKFQYVTPSDFQKYFSNDTDYSAHLKMAGSIEN